MASSAEVELAVRKALEETEAKRLAEEKEIGCGDVLGISPTRYRRRDYLLGKKSDQ